MGQRKLEFAFWLATMAADRLPAWVVAAAGWPQLARKGLPSMHAWVVASLERAVGLNVVGLAAAAGTSRASLKQTASGAVRKQDVREMRRKVTSTVGHHLRVLLGDQGEQASQLQRYLAGPLTKCSASSSYAARVSCLRPDAAFSRARPRRRGAHSARSAWRKPCIMLCWRARPLIRAAMWAAVTQEVGRLAVSTAQTLPAEQQLAALLGNSFWGDCAPAVDAVVQQYLAAQMKRRRSAVPAAAVPAAVVPAAVGGAACNPADVACQATSAAVRPLCYCAIAAAGSTTRTAWYQRCLVCLMVIVSAPAVLLPRRLPPHLPLPLPFLPPAPGHCLR
jgi:hypothetical protein